MSSKVRITITLKCGKTFKLTTVSNEGVDKSFGLVDKVWGGVHSGGYLCVDKNWFSLADITHYSVTTPTFWNRFF